VIFPTRTDSIENRVLEALGCAMGALSSPIASQLRTHTEESRPRSVRLDWRRTDRTDHAAFHNSALVRYLDFNDSYLAKGETCHPSDNLGCVLAGCEYATRSGRIFSPLWQLPTRYSAV